MSTSTPNPVLSASCDRALKLALMLGFALTGAAAGCDSPAEFLEGDDLELRDCGNHCGVDFNTPYFYGNERFIEFDIAGGAHTNTEGHTVTFHSALHPSWGALAPGELAVHTNGKLSHAGLPTGDPTGLTLAFTIDGQATKLRVATALERPDVGWVYEFEEVVNDEWVPLCEPDPYGDRSAYLYRDFTLVTNGPATGRIVDAYDMIQIACTSGAAGKATSFGFRPLIEDEMSQDMFEAALRAVRLDLCSDGTAYTVPGAEVAFNDMNGKVESPLDTEGLIREAIFDKWGAVCWDGALRPGATAPSCELPLCDDWLTENASRSDLVETFIQ